MEIIDGIIVVTPPPAAPPNRIAEKVHRRLYTVVPDDWGVYQTLGVAHPSRGRLCVPDLVVIAESAVAELEGSEAAPLMAAELIVEITSLSNASHDRLTKPLPTRKPRSRYTCSSTASLPPDRPSPSTVSPRATSTASSAR
ncbi:Uma2 family endonuclease [Streptomyces sp. NPDC013953]|uniref:Uma2 family endonuclease n=1 Tax=Streptomyces sp. NPDC013953 TaxID=3364868 RepID=UPI0036FF0108